VQRSIRQAFILRAKNDNASRLYRGGRGGSGGKLTAFTGRGGGFLTIRKAGLSIKGERGRLNYKGSKRLSSRNQKGFMRTKEKGSAGRKNICGRGGRRGGSLSGKRTFSQTIIINSKT